MIYVRSFAVATCVLLFGTATLHARDLSRYREFQLGSTLASVQKTSGTTAGDVRLIHQRPAVIQELRWRPPLGYSNTMEPTEAVREAIFTFYNDQLFQIVVDYDRQRTEGLTDADLIEAISGRYGVATLKASPLRTDASPSVMSTDGAIVVAQWSDAEVSLSLVRGTYPTTLRLVMVLKSVEALARTAVVDALRQDREEAPQREIDRMNKIAEDGRVTAEKARVVNKPRFTP
jgi:hypothetical protein